MKIYLKQNIPYRYGRAIYPFIIKKGFYLAEEVPPQYYPETLKLVEKSYIIKCLDNKYRKISASECLTIKELRKSRLKSILENNI